MLGKGSIPACAGKPEPLCPDPQPSRVHPRVCGEAWSTDPYGALVMGPSPRVRGSPGRLPPRHTAGGSIPACAGKPPDDTVTRPSGRVHPRVCGEAKSPTWASARWRGPSPRVRGSRTAAPVRKASKRSIPACAGKPGSATSRGLPPAVHPRVCGEASTIKPTPRAAWGPSPRVRGSPDRAVSARPRRRIACSGPRLSAALRSRLPRPRSDVPAGGSVSTSRRTFPMLPRRFLRSLLPPTRGSGLVSSRSAFGDGSVRRDRLRDRHRPPRQRLRGRTRCRQRRPGRPVPNLPDPAASRTVHVHQPPRSALGRRTQRADLRRSVAGAPHLARRRGVRRRPQRAFRPQRAARLLRPLPAAPPAGAVHLYGATRPRAVGDPTDEVARRLPAAAYPAASPRPGIGRGGVRAYRARGGSGRLAGAQTPSAASRRTKEHRPAARA